MREGGFMPPQLGDVLQIDASKDMALVKKRHQRGAKTGHGPSWNSGHVDSFSEDPTPLHFQSLGRHTNQLPWWESKVQRFFEASMQALKSLHTLAGDLGRYNDTDKARAEALWCSHGHRTRVSNACDWRSHLHKSRENAITNYETKHGLTWEEHRKCFDENLQPCIRAAKKFFA